MPPKPHLKTNRRSTPATKNEMNKKELRVFAVMLVLLLGSTEAFLAHNTLYTEGEVMQGLYWLLVSLNIPILVAALWKPRAGTWCAFSLGALLLPWQASENRKWALIHEEVFAIINHAETKKKSSGDYPSSLESYDYLRPWTQNHISYGTSDGTYSITYFMDDSGISYWYDSQDGFGYYPD